MPRAEKPRSKGKGGHLGTDSKMFDWSAQDRVSQVPATIWPGLGSGKGRDHLFVGRRAELDKLEQRHSRLPEQVDRSLPAEQQSFVTVVTNAPGVGKSALLEQLQEQHVATGGYFLGLHATDLLNEERLREALLLSEPAQEAELLRRAKIAKRLAKALTVAMDQGTAGASIAQLVFEHVVEAATKLDLPGPEAAGTLAHARMVERLARYSRSLNAMQLLRIMGEGAEGRLIIIVDEAQELGASGDNRTGKLLHQLGDPSERTRLKLRGGGVVLAGLPDAIQRLEELHKSRAHQMHLAPLKSEEVEELLRVACAHGNERDRLNPREINHIVKELARDFGDWTHHAHSAGYAAQHILRNATKAGPTVEMPGVEELINWMRTNAALGVCGLYDGIAQKAAGMIGIEGVQAAAHAMAMEGEVPQQLLEGHMDAWREGHGLDKIAQIDNYTALRFLLHYGLIGRERGEGGGITGRLEIPIPTLTAYLNVTEGRAMRETIEEPRIPDVGQKEERVLRQKRQKKKPRGD